MPGTRALHYVARTDKGLRQSNADAVFAGPRLFIVADGVGTSKNSALASDMAVVRIRDACDAGESLQEAVQLAHGDLLEFNLQQTTEKAVGTTIVVASLRDPEDEIMAGMVVWAGDSRAYVIDVQKNHITQLTQDHSYVNTLVQQGDITSEQARSHPRRNVITRCLGLTQKHDIKLDSQEFALQQHQYLLLCSDGLSGSLRKSALLKSLQRAQDLDCAANDLLQQALQAGSKDNISLVLVHRV